MKDLYIVLEFRGKYRWLSNFHEVPIEFEGNTYQSTESAYQAAKCANIEDRALLYSNPSMTSADSKRIGSSVKLRDDWTEELRLKTMYKLNRQKFLNNADLAKKLIATGEAILMEGNLWGDTFWGVDLKTGIGDNHLGRILMEIRFELMAEEVGLLSSLMV